MGNGDGRKGEKERGWSEKERKWLSAQTTPLSSVTIGRGSSPREVRGKDEGLIRK